MPATILCPTCGKELQAPATEAGAPLRCGACNNLFNTPAPSGHVSTSVTTQARNVAVLQPPAADSRPATLGADDLAVLRMDEPVANALPHFPGYEVLGPLGQGGMGQIYKARHLNLDRMVALKVIRRELLGDADTLRRFQREARAAARLAHANIVTIHDAAEAHGVQFLVMELVEGESLATLVQHGPLPVAQVCDWMRQAALGLAHIHERGLVHRDVKPHNLLVSADRRVLKILDLGLGRLDSDPRRGTKLTQFGMMLGTPAYFAPEQVVDAAQVDGRADIYSLGCTMYHLLAGRTPFHAGSAESYALRHMSAEVEPLDKLRPELPAALVAIMRQMMAKSPRERYQTAGEVATALEPYCKTTPLAPRQPAEAASRSQQTVTYRASPAKTVVLPVAHEPSPQGLRQKRFLLLAGGAALGVFMLMAILALSIGLLSWWIFGAAGKQGADNAPAQPEGAVPAGWITFTSPSGLYSVALPHLPKQDAIYHTAAAPKNGAKLMTAAAPIPAKEAADPKTVFHDATKSYVTRSMGTLQTEKVIAADGFEGRELTIALPKVGDRPASAFVRIFLVRTHLVFLDARTLGTDPDAEIQAFLASLKILVKDNPANKKNLPFKNPPKIQRTPIGFTVMVLEPGWNILITGSMVDGKAKPANIQLHDQRDLKALQLFNVGSLAELPANYRMIVEALLEQVEGPDPADNKEAAK